MLQKIQAIPEDIFVMDNFATYKTSNNTDRDEQREDNYTVDENSDK